MEILCWIETLRYHGRKQFHGPVAMKKTSKEGWNYASENVSCSNSSCKWNRSFINSTKNEIISCSYNNRIILTSLMNVIGYQGASHFLACLGMKNNFSRATYFKIASKHKLGVSASTFSIIYLTIE